MTCCLECTHWYYEESISGYDWDKEPGVCTLYPTHQKMHVRTLVRAIRPQKRLGTI
jgi:hypothetical protein